MDPNIHSKYASSGEIGQTTSLEYIVEGLLDGTEYTVTVLPYYDLGWDGVEGGNTTCFNVFQCDIMKESKTRQSKLCKTLRGPLTSGDWIVDTSCYMMY